MDTLYDALPSVGINDSVLVAAVKATGPEAFMIPEDEGEDPLDRGNEGSTQPSDWELAVKAAEEYNQLQVARRTAPTDQAVVRPDDDDGDSEADANKALADLARVLYMRLSFQNIRGLSNLAGLENVRKLQLDNNNISKIEGLETLVHLTNLDLSFNEITEIENLDTLTRLKELSLHHNGISELKNMDNMRLLTVFSIGDNKLSNPNQVVYLRRFPALAILNVKGNPMCNEPEYKAAFVIARISTLRYLDYQFIRPHDRSAAEDTHQEELRELAVSEADFVAAEKKKQDERERLELLSAKRLAAVNRLPERMLAEDEELPKIHGLPGTKEAYQELVEKSNIILDEFVKDVMEKREAQDSEAGEFEFGWGKVRGGADAFALEQLAEFRRAHKATNTEVQGMLSTAIPKSRRAKSANREVLPQESVRRIEELIGNLKDKNDECRDHLMERELLLVEMFEDYSAEYQTRLGAHVRNVQALISSSFGLLREEETHCHDRIQGIAMMELQRFSKQEADDLDEATRTLLSDKEGTINVVAASHEGQSGKLEAAEDELMKGETQWAEKQVAAERHKEHMRYVNRVSEIGLLHTYHEAQMQQLQTQVDQVLQGTARVDTRQKSRGGE